MFSRSPFVDFVQKFFPAFLQELLGGFRSEAPLGIYSRHSFRNFSEDFLQKFIWGFGRAITPRISSRNSSGDSLQEFIQGFPLGIRPGMYSWYFIDFFSKYAFGNLPLELKDFTRNSSRDFQQIPKAFNPRISFWNCDCSENVLRNSSRDFV